MKYLMVALLVLYVSSTAYANCIYNGQSYPVGTVLDGLYVQWHMAATIEI